MSMSAAVLSTAHELRNPLASLGLSLDVLVADFDQLPTESRLALIQRARRSVTFLNGLVENMTPTAAADAGRLQVESTCVDLGPTIEDAIGLDVSGPE